MTVMDLVERDTAKAATKIAANLDSRTAAPCVFCLGNTAFLSECEGCDGVTRYAIECSLCLACGPLHPTPEAAVKDWNFAWERLQHYINQMGRWVEENKR